VAAIQDLLERAQHTGEVRADVTVEDLFGMVVGCAMSRGTDAVSQTRMLSVVCEGLKT
jgi:transcriptional regulator SbtR-like protein